MDVQQLYSILDNTVEAVLVCNAQGVLTYCNKRTIEFHGLPLNSIPPEEWVNFYGLYKPDGVTPFQKEELPLYRALHGETVNGLEVLIAPKHRSPILVSASGRPLFDEKGELTGAIVTMSDITQSRKIHEELNSLNRQLEQRVAERTARLNFLDRITSLLLTTLDHEEIIYQIAVSGLPFMADGCIIDLITGDRINRLMTKHLDPGVEFLMKEHQRLYPLELAGPSPSAVAMRNGQSILKRTIDYENVRTMSKDQTQYELLKKIGINSMIAVPLICRGETIGALNLIITTDRKPFEVEDFTITEELARRLSIAIENSRLYSDAQSAIKQRDEFISLASHELKTPITSLKLQLEAISRSISKNYIERIDHEYIKKFSSNSLKQVDRLGRLVDDMLDISRISIGRLAMNKKVSDLSDICHEVLARFSAQLSDQKITVESFIEDGLIIECDPYRIEQVITNLMSNAIRYGEKRQIEVSLKKDSKTAVFKIKDHGRGIDPVDHERIFNRFERAIGPTDISGLGLGLYISRQIAEEHSGSIRVESELGLGITFIFTIPLYE